MYFLASVTVAFLIIGNVSIFELLDVCKAKLCTARTFLGYPNVQKLFVCFTVLRSLGFLIFTVSFAP